MLQSSLELWQVAVKQFFLAVPSCTIALVMVAPARTDCIFFGTQDLISCLHRRRYDPGPAERHGEVESSISMSKRFAPPLQTL